MSTAADLLRLRRDLAGRGRWDNDEYLNPKLLDKSLQTQKVTGAIVDSVKDKQDEDVSKVIEAKDALFGETKDIERDKVREDKKKLLRALQTSDIMCEPLSESRKMFTEHNLMNLEKRLMDLTQKSRSGQEPRFVFTALKGEKDILSKIQDEKKSSVQQSDLLLEDEKASTAPIQVLYFKPVEDMPRIPVGVMCKVENGQFTIVAKNVPQDQINSQYYIKRAKFLVFVEKKPGGKLERRYIFDIALDGAIGTEGVHWLRLTELTDWVWLNVNFPEVKPMIFTDTEAHVLYIQEQINKLQEDHLRLQSSLRTRVEQLQQELKQRVIDTLGNYGFVGALGQLSDCLLSSYNKDTGIFEDKSYFDCLSEVLKRNEFYQNLKEIKKKRDDLSDAQKKGSGEWIDKLQFNEPKTGTVLGSEHILAKGFKFLTEGENIVTSVAPK